MREHTGKHEGQSGDRSGEWVGKSFHGVFVGRIVEVMSTVQD